MALSKYKFLSLAACVVLIGCYVQEDKPHKKASSPTYSGAHSVFVHNGNVYVAGEQEYYYSPSTPLINHATLWKNGVVHFESDIAGSTASSVFVSNSDVHMVGTWGLHWENNVLRYLSNEQTRIVSPQSIFVIGGDVFIAGWDEKRINNKDVIYTAMLWKNGVAQYLNFLDESDSSKATSVFVSGGDVYVAGSENNKAVVWKNGASQFLVPDDALPSYANSVFVTSDDTYVAGTEGNQAVLWKNGIKHYMNDSGDEMKSFAASVYVSGADVYVSGMEEQNERGSTVLWKNGAKQCLTDTTSFWPSNVGSVYVSGEDVYVVGTEHSVATLWKNGVPQRLTK